MATAICTICDGRDCLGLRAQRPFIEAQLRLRRNAGAVYRDLMQSQPHQKQQHGTIPPAS